MLVSVIIPYFRKKNYITSAVKSVLNQSYRNFEIIIIYDDEIKDDLKLINNLKKLDKIKFPTTKIIDLIPKKNSLFETIIVSANDELVNLFLKKRISFFELYKSLEKILKLKEFQNFKNKKPKNINEINKLNLYVRLKVKQLCI